MKNKCECEYQDHPYGDTYVTEKLTCQYCYRKELDRYESRFDEETAKTFLVMLLQVEPDKKLLHNGDYSECRYCHGRNRFDKTGYKIEHYEYCPYANALDVMLGDGWDERRPRYAETIEEEPYIPELDENGEEIIPF